ncbi:nucleoside triphosphate pyrophosphohydrolase family protein [Candidatus Saccharibacteria bacterium]|nr:nucleoside triphosphate pyrophosphohydrolase family protein [Candidatus Saccharibacteria bacterium]
MGFDEYQEKAAKCDLYKITADLSEVGFVEKVLGLTGEAGETADKIKKILRDKNGAVSDEDKDAITKELGDVLWYMASIARYLGVPLSKVAALNIEKLESRMERGVLHGSGDER